MVLPHADDCAYCLHAHLLRAHSYTATNACTCVLIICGGITPADECVCVACMLRAHSYMATNACTCMCVLMIICGGIDRPLMNVCVRCMHAHLLRAHMQLHYTYLRWELAHAVIT